MPHLVLKATDKASNTNTYSILCKSDDIFILNIYKNNIINIAKGLVTYEFDIELTNSLQSIQYIVNSQPYSFTVPSLNQPLNVLHMSCNNIYQNNVWTKIQLQHECEPYHVAIGGGDQIYMDDVWEIPHLKDWYFDNIDNIDNITNTSKDIIIDDVTNFYRNMYENKWFDSPEYLNVLPNIPSINMWDDHDIFDGYGSFPSKVQNSPVVQIIYKTNQRNKHHCQKFELNQQSHN